MRASLSILGLYNYDNSVLDGLIVPGGLDRETLIEYIFMECADMELLYPEFDLMKQLIKSWAAARRHSWERLYQSTVQQYNMLHNFDRYEEWRDTGNGTAKGSTGRNKAGYNSSEMVATEKDDAESSTNSTSTHNGHLYGNIGITTPVQMLTGERELYKWDVYSAIAHEFKERFCNLVY